MVLDSETSLGYSWTGVVSVSSRGSMRSALLVKMVKTISFFLSSLPSPQVVLIEWRWLLLLLMLFC